MCYTSSMKLSQYAKEQGISYSTALRWWHQGTLRGYQAPSGTIIVEPRGLQPTPEERVAIYARVSSAEHRENLERQAERLTHYCTARGYQVVKLVKEVGSGVNDSRPKLLSLLRDPMIRGWWLNRRIDSPASVSGISRPLWKSKEEQLKWSILQTTTKKTCFMIWQVSSTRSA